ncbi:MAG: type II toxin-antitoxin system death-on-curing family toxin [Ruminiclostridium sp.]|nr:type II toxin-antitoxin system death-on-curing family toxin [Ruminiclostridium sp.]
MICLTVDEVILLHEKLIQSTGGAAGLRDRGLLESAVWSATIQVGNVEPYPTAEEKAARLAFALVNNHAFLDGNKRVGILAMLMMLSLNGVAVSYTQGEVISLGLAVAAGTTGYDEILDWIRVHKKDRS